MTPAPVTSVAAPSPPAPPKDRRRALLLLQYAVFPLALLIVWQVFSEIGFVRRNVMPPPTTVLAIWYDLITGATDAAARYSGTWLDHAWASTWRVFAGFGWGVGLGIVIGLLIGLSKIVERMFDPTIQVLRNIPVTAWVPLVDHANVGQGTRILIHAAAGGVGGNAVQIARHFGAEIVATCSTRNIDYVRSLEIGRAHV